MSEYYTKLDSSLPDSTIWDEDAETCKLWITMLAKKGADGVVRASIPGLARAARISVEKCIEALTKFESPDLFTSSPEWEGRRIEKVDKGWKVLNHEKFQELGWSEEKKEHERDKKAAQRLALKAKLEAQKAADQSAAEIAKNYVPNFKKEVKRRTKEAHNEAKKNGAKAAIKNGLDEANSQPREEEQ